MSLLGTLAPFATEGSHIEFAARHAGSWRYVVQGGNLVRQDSMVVFE